MNNARTYLFIVIVFSFTSMNASAQSELDPEILNMYAFPVEDPRTPEEIIVALSRKFDADSKKVRIYHERFSNLGIEAIDVLESNLRSGKHDFKADYQVSLLASKLRQLEDQLEAQRKTDLVELMVQKSEVAGTANILWATKKIDHPALRELAYNSITDISSPITASAIGYLESIGIDVETSQITTSNGSQEAPALDVTIEDKLQPEPEITVQSETKSTEEEEVLPEPESKEKATPWWPWTVIGVLVIAVIIGLVSRRKKQTDP